ncbi:urea transporter [Paraburkholderia sp. D15]|uniref:urea transporter n=1 Tax=Paraburkholderia sp. D15 TaxID=2880218 RepID=UPI0024788397|nr:urea transporter [Paraburkholderia sp. D15]WGS54729.1 urea transporter [Paraburkholderia sp. D15]
MHAVTTKAESTALRTLLRSVGQIVLQPNAFTGACIIAALLLAEPRLACAALIGAIAANVSAMLTGYRDVNTRTAHARDADTRDGLHGFNGALAGLAAFHFIADDATAAAVAILSATLTVWFLDPWSRRLRANGLSVFSSPYLIATWLWLPLLTTASAASSAAGVAAQPFEWMQWVNGVLGGFGQIFFVPGALPGLLVLIGIAGASRQSALWAFAGTALGCAGHVLLGASASSLDAGLLGFNGALTAIALADCGAVATLAGVGVSIVLQTGASYLGWPAMTAPFVLASWSVQWVRHRAASSRADAANANRPPLRGIG